MAYQGGSQTLRYAIFTKNILTPEEAELYELANLAGVVADPRVFKIIVDLLRLNVAPTAIERMLKSMTAQTQRPSTAEGHEGHITSSSSSTSSSGRGRPSGLRKPTQRS